MVSTVKTEIGRFVWHEQISADPEAAQRFYTELLGWEIETWKSGEGIPDYPMIKAHDTTHGGFRTAEGGAPPNWNGSVFVEDVDDTVLRAEGAGGAVMFGPVDIPEIGRVAVVADPQGGVTAPFRPAGDPPSSTGVFLWDELMTDDVEGAKHFYTEVFGWTTEDMDMGEMGTYTLLKRGSDPDAGGILQKPPGALGGALWIPYLAAEDVDASAAKAKELGGTAIMEPYDVPTVGRMAVMVDPTGASFGLFRASEETR